MAERDDRFRPRVSPPRSKGTERFISRVLRSASRAGTVRAGKLTPARKNGAKFGRGHAAAAFAGRGLNARSRRVVIKTRLVVLKTAGPRSTATHLRYLERDGVTKEGRPGQAYDARHEVADTSAFEERGRGDRHQFRFIVAPEEAEALGDLHRFTRDLMGRMESDLGTRLDWIAVDHWDTDNQHTHVVLRGKDEAGRDLVIARDYIAHGMRLRASALATEWLGPRTEQEIRQCRLREVDEERWTGLDRSLQQFAKNHIIERAALSDPKQRSLLIGRLQRLTTMGLADEKIPGVWRLPRDLERTLRTMGERGDIVRTMQRAFGSERREFVIEDAERIGTTITGRIAAKGLADELSERGYVVIDGLDGRAHYVALSAATNLGDLPLGGIVEAQTGSGRRVDATIASLAREGIYRTSTHRAELGTRPDSELDGDTVVTAHVRRLEALRRTSLVERLADGVWRVPEDFVERAAAHDRSRLGDVSVTRRSHLPIERQVRAIGATWLDRQLLTKTTDVAETGFGADVRDALVQRSDFLVEEGLAERHGARVVLVRDLLATLRNRELATVARSIKAETGLAHRPIVDRQRVSGIYRRSVLLASGRFALLDDGVGFSLVPWRPVIERRLGQSVIGIVRRGDVSWDFSRQRGLGIG
jgi:type IV secretory pathway VirD2 relaxase